MRMEWGMEPYRIIPEVYVYVNACAETLQELPDGESIN